MSQYIFYAAILSVFVFSSCVTERNPEKPLPPSAEEGAFYLTEDNLSLFYYSFEPEEPNGTIYIISGYTGINHNSESDVIEILSNNNKNRVVVLHPRGTGYSDGERGDVRDYERFINDFVEFITWDNKLHNSGKVILYGHSISTAMSLAINDRLSFVDGLIMVNPPFRMKNSEGMTPTFSQYLKYAFYFIFMKHTPVVNMGGDPSAIIDPDERLEAEERSRDPLLVKYISMYMMFESRKLLDDIPAYAEKSETPLLLLYGEKDSLVEKSGCDEIYSLWKGEKEYHTVKDGPHGKLTVILAAETIKNWLDNLR